MWVLADERLKAEIFHKCDMVEGLRRACSRYPHRIPLADGLPRAHDDSETTNPGMGGKVEVLPEGDG